MRIADLARNQQRPGWVDPVTGTIRATPWTTRTAEAVYSGSSPTDVWMYRILENRSLRHADAGELLDRGQQLAALLADIGSSSIRQPPGGLVTAGLYREMHILAVRTVGPAQVPAETPTGQLATYLERLLRFDAPQLTVFVGIQLRTLNAARAARGRGSFATAMLDLIDGLFDTQPTDHQRFDTDRKFLDPIFARAGCRFPTAEERTHLEAWWNGSAHTEPEVLAHPDHLVVDRRSVLRFSALADFAEPVMAAPWRQWVADTMDHPDGPAAVSIRFELQPASDTRKALRRTLVRQAAEAQEAAKEVGPARREETEAAQLAAFAEGQVAGTASPATLRNVSIVFGHAAPAGAVETYEDFLRATYGIDVKPLVHRQIAALEEVQPGGVRRASPFPQHLMPQMVAYAGIGVATAVGDSAGALLGRGIPDGVPVYFDPVASSRANTPPGFGIFGVPGSGKTLTALHLTYQAALGGTHTIFINPQVGHSMIATAEFMASAGIEVEHVSLTKLLTSEGGTYDPFRYAATRETAAALTSTYLTTILDLDQRQRTALRAGLNRGAKAGARCVGQALDLVDDPAVVELVRDTAESTPLVALVVGTEPRSRLVADPGQPPAKASGRGRFTLVELDMDLGLPSHPKPTYTDAEKIGIATVQAITAASVGILAGQHGGLLMVDEAHNLLHGETIRGIDKLLREGRKLNVCLGMITQQARDLLDAGMETYISRVLALRMTDAADAAAALKLCGYEPSPERIEQMRTFGAQRRADGGFDPALGYFRDVHDRKALLSIDPLGADFLKAASTNVDDEAARRRAANAGMEAEL